MSAKLGREKIADRLTKRKKAKLNEVAAKRLLAYASVAAGAACIPQAQAEVVYTPVHRGIHLNYALDLNNDGIVDFRITSGGFSEIYSLSVRAADNGNRIGAAHGKGCYLKDSAVALPAGAVIGPTKSFTVSATCMFSGYFGANGPWAGLENHYLGLEFEIDGKTHFGWARISVNRNICYGCEASIQGYAYETEPGKAIRAGDEGGSAEAEVAPGSLGALALGAGGR